MRPPALIIQAEEDDHKTAEECRKLSKTSIRPTAHLRRDTVGQCLRLLLSNSCGWSPSTPVLNGLRNDAGDTGRTCPPKRLGRASPREGTGGRLKVQPGSSTAATTCTALQASVADTCMCTLAHWSAVLQEYNSDCLPGGASKAVHLQVCGSKNSLLHVS
jgi:hypothetical protein